MAEVRSHPLGSLDPGPRLPPSCYFFNSPSFSRVSRGRCETEEGPASRLFLPRELPGCSVSPLVTKPCPPFEQPSPFLLCLSVSICSFYSPGFP